MHELSKIDQSLIEKNFDKTLTDNELTTFNQRLTDATFAAEVQRYEKAVTAVKAFGDKNLKALLQEEEARLQGQTVKIADITPPPASIGTSQYSEPKLRSVGQKWAIAANLLLVVSALAWYFLPKKTDTSFSENKNIYATYFKPYRNYEKPTVRDNTQKDLLEKAFSLYDNGDFQGSLTYFEQVPSQISTKIPPQYSALFYQANAYLATNQLGKALPILENLAQSPQSEWQLRAEWYWALALSETQPAKAKMVFEKIRNTTNHPYQKQVESVLNLN
jgi:hypothetical protein